MQDRLKHTISNSKKINNMPKVYLVGCWARYGVREYPFAGKFIDNEVWYKEPLVWYEEDRNGTYEEYLLKPISMTTTGESVIYCFNRVLAQRLVDSLNRAHGFETIYEGVTHE